MTDLASDYTPLDLRSRFRTQAVRVWAVAIAVVTVWTGAIVLAPILAPAGAASSIYSFFSYICHQMPERSFHIGAHQMAVCTRCFGVYFGLLAGMAVYPLWRSIEEIDPIPRFWLFLSLIPITIDWSLTVFGIWENTHVSRFLTGSILGLACAIFIVPALVEVVRNLSTRQRTQ